MLFLCNGGSLYAPYSLLSISNMLCGGRGNRVVTVAVVYDPVFRVRKYGPWIHRPRLHKTTYAPMIYTSLCVMFLMWRDRLRGEVGGGLVFNKYTVLPG
jgi:hypothetical protein